MGDISKLEVDVIVNSTTSNLICDGGGGTFIHKTIQ